MRRLMVLFMLISLPWILDAASVASLGTLEGEVMVTRSGIVIPSEKVAEGGLLEAFDTISTGQTGRAEIQFSPATGIQGSIRLDPGTTVYLDLSPVKTEQVAGVELLAGSVSVRLSRLEGSSLIEVRTELGTFGGSALSFRVAGSQQGDVLVQALAGKVLCRLESRTLYAEPNSVVEVLTPEGGGQSYRVNVTTLDAYEAAWMAGRHRVLRDQATQFFRIIGSRYLLQSALFQRSWDRVQQESKETDAFDAAVANLRRAAFPLERSWFRILALRGLFQDGQLSPSAELNRGYAAKDFFRRVSLDETQALQRLADARALYRAVAERRGGTFPRIATNHSVTWDTDFFH